LALNNNHSLTHSPSLFQYLSQCDGIIVFTNGRITERGKHSDLMARNEEYSNLITTFYTQNDSEKEEVDFLGNVTVYLLADTLRIKVGWFMVFNATFNNISFTSWQSVLLVEETGVLGKNH